MDILSPDLLWIDDRCYRLPVLDSLHTESHRNFEETQWVENEQPLACDEINDEDDDDDDIEELIETLPNNRYKLSLSIPQTFWSKIIGAKGATKKRIESDTQTTLTIPRPMEHGDVVIKGSSKRGIILAKKNIDSIVTSARQKLVFTHFISIPMNGEQIKNNFIVFKEEVLKSCGKDRGIDASIFQNPDKLHLTIGTLVLTDQNERKLAETLLNEVFQKSIRPILDTCRGHQIEMKGIEYMNDDPAEVDVLYGKITSGGEQDFLQNVADSILRFFNHHKLIKTDSTEKVKLHVTLMNTLFRDEEPEELNQEIEAFNRNNRSKKPRRTFNAVNVLQKFSNFYFGQQDFKSIQLSVRYSTGKDGYYKSSCVLNV